MPKASKLTSQTQIRIRERFPSSSRGELAERLAMYETLGSNEPLVSAESFDFSRTKKSELVRDQLLALLEVEKSYSVEPVPCRAICVPEDERIPLDDWRRKICQWSFRVIDHFRFDREVVSTGMNLFDRFLVLHRQQEDSQDGSLSSVDCSCSCPSCKRSMDSRTYQLAAMTCVFLAVKLHSENSHSDSSSLTARRQHHFKLTTFVELSRGQFRAQDICDMERTVLQTLVWKVSPPTPMTFVSYLVTLMPDRDVMPSVSQPYYDLVIHVLRELSRYLTELAVCVGGECAHYSSSQIAFAAIMVSMDLLTNQACPLQVRDYFRQEASQVCCGTSQLQRSIMKLYSILQRALWPEMLLDSNDEHTPESGHPISIARDFGLLDMDRIYQAQQQRSSSTFAAQAGYGTTAFCPGQETPPGSPKRQDSLQESPVSVAR